MWVLRPPRAHVLGTHGGTLWHLHGRFPDVQGKGARKRQGREWTQPKPEPALESKGLAAPLDPSAAPTRLAAALCPPA